jgi:hypothetical protein
MQAATSSVNQQISCPALNIHWQVLINPPMSWSCSLWIDQLMSCKLQPVRQSAVLVLCELINWCHASCNQSANQLLLSSGNWSADSMQAATSPPSSSYCPLGIDQLIPCKLQPVRQSDVLVLCDLISWYHAGKLQPDRKSAVFLFFVDYLLASLNQSANQLFMSSGNGSADARHTATNS